MLRWSRRREVYCGHDEEEYERLCALLEQSGIPYDTRLVYGHNTLTFGFARGNPEKAPGKTNYSSLYYVYVEKAYFAQAEYLIRNAP